MKIATILFTYNRSRHTEEVITALRSSKILPEKLFVFQDGLKCEAHRSEWEKVNILLRKIDWCDHEIIISEKNKGLAESVIFGVNYVFKKFEAIIVLEDDCVPHPGFMTFMTQSLQKYRFRKEVYSVSGYSYPVDVKTNGKDAYFIGRTSSWGWGTWKNRWTCFKSDYKILGRIMNDPELSEQLHIWGEDLENYLLGNIYGNCNSWATFWALNVIEQRGYCLSPYMSLIKNIGFDGTGVHCGKAEVIQRLYKKDKCNFQLPDEIEISEDCKTAFSDCFSWISAEKKLNSYNELLIKWINYLLDGNILLADRLRERGYKKCSVWGRGKLFDLLLKDFEGKIEILSIIESNPVQKEYRGIPIVGVNEIPKDSQLIIVIPMYDFQKIGRMLEKSEQDKLRSLEYIFEI